MRVSLVIPAYNEEDRLPRFLGHLSQFVKAHPAILQEVLIVNDGSKDRTQEIAEAQGHRLPHLQVLRQPTNQGKGAAVQRGINAAQSDAVLFMDADGATPAGEIPKVLAALERTPIVVGNRWKAHARERGQTPFRSFSSVLLRMMMALFGLSHVDTMCGCKAFRRDVAVQLFNPLFEPRWLFDQEVLFRARLLRFPMASVPIQWTSQRGSKLRFSTFLVSALRLPLLLGKVWWALRIRESTTMSAGHL